MLYMPKQSMASQKQPKSLLQQPHGHHINSLAECNGYAVIKAEACSSSAQPAKSMQLQHSPHLRAANCERPTSTGVHQLIHIDKWFRQVTNSGSNRHNGAPKPAHYLKHAVYCPTSATNGIICPQVAQAANTVASSLICRPGSLLTALLGNASASR